MDPPKPLEKGSAIPLVITPSLTRYYRLLPHKPPVWAAISGKMSETARKGLTSKEVRIPRSLLDHALEGFRRVMDMGSYLEWMMRGFYNSGALNNVDKVARAIWVSSRQAINNLNSVSAVCNANLTLFRRQVVIDAFKSNLPDESLRKLREAPFDSRDLIPDELFREVLQETRAARHDDVLLEPIRQRHTYRGGRHSSPSRGGSGTSG